MSLSPTPKSKSNHAWLTSAWPDLQNSIFVFIFISARCLAPGALGTLKTFFSSCRCCQFHFFFHKEKPLKHQASSGKGKIKRHLESYCRNLSSIVKQVKTGSLVPAVLEVCWTAARYGGLFAIWPYASTFRGQPESWIKTGYDLWSHFAGSLFFFSSFFFLRFLVILSFGSLDQ